MENNNFKVAEFKRVHLSRKDFLRSKKGSYRAGDVLMVPFMNIVNRKGKRGFEKIPLKHHYYIVTSATKKEGHDLELILIDGMYSDRHLYQGQVFISKECGLPVDSVAKANAIILADSEDIHLNGAYIFTTLPEDVVTSVRMQMCSREVFKNWTNLPKVQKGERLYIRYEVFDYEEPEWQTALRIDDSLDAFKTAEELQCLLSKDIFGCARGHIQLLVSDQDTLKQAAKLLEGRHSFVFVHRA